MSGSSGGASEGDVRRRLDDVTEALQALFEVLDQEEDLSAILDRVCEQAVRAVPGADLASISLLREGVPETAALTDEHALAVDEAQYRSGEGPCLEAARTRRCQRVSVPEVSRRWPVFARSATALGVASYLSAPLVIDTEYQGSLNLYSRQPHGFRELDAALLELYSTAAEAALRNARRYRQARAQAVHLRTALASRAVIDQAKGVLMAVHRVGADEAFALLVQRSQQENLKVRELAERFLADLLTPDG